MSEPKEMPEELATRHRKEKKDLIAHITAIKRLVPKGDKHRKKEAAVEIAALEKELSERHAAEIKAMDEATNTEPSDAPSHDNDMSHGENGLQSSQAEDEDQSRSTEAVARHGGKKNKAKMRLQRRAEEMKRMQEKAEREAEGMVDETAIEAEAISRLVASEGLSVKEIRPDGHCLYSAVADQLSTYHGQPSATYLEMRKRTAEYMRTNQDDFLPFMAHGSGAAFSEADFADYCNAVENTADWGGHQEIAALSRTLRLPIHIYQTGTPVLRIGDDEYSTDHPIRLSYHRRAYGLGEHYNSLHNAST
ncbi:OTU protein [Coemansia sp. RSA 1285]|nr:OTU protein [Coemansia sp. RSA 1804]KAJ2694353.1 OTU protein [Coemansia sp. RSA 1285]